MFSMDFASSYCFFSAAVTAYRQAVHNTGNRLEIRAVDMAFRKATLDMSSKEQDDLILFLQTTIQQPGDYEKVQQEQIDEGRELDSALMLNISKLFEKGDLVYPEVILARTGMTKGLLLKKVRRNECFIIKKQFDTDFDDSYIPSFFSEPKYETQLLERVSTELRSLSGIQKYRFFTSPNSSLKDNTPLDALALGALEPVLTVARVFYKRYVFRRHKSLIP